MPPTTTMEWLEADGLGGFAFGPIRGPRTRRYHAVLLANAPADPAAAAPALRRFVLVNGFDAWIEMPDEHGVRVRHAISTQRYSPGVDAPDGDRHLAGFFRDPWPRWVFRLDDGTEVIQELTGQRGTPVVALAWRLAEPRPGVSLVVRPFLSGRDFHALHKENPAFHFEAEPLPHGLRWRPYPGVPSIRCLTTGRFTPEPLWYRDFEYDEEHARGLDFVEDLASPGSFRWSLSDAEAVWILAAESGDPLPFADGDEPREVIDRIRASESERRERLTTPLRRASEDYVVRRGQLTTIVAGYPWFSDWGRDSFIALRGLALATGRLDVAREVLLGWIGLLADGMLPNHCPDRGERPEYNSVDASLWFIITAHEYLTAAERAGVRDAVGLRQLRDAIAAILHAYARGTRHGIHADSDGLLAAGEPGVQVTWMDAMVDGQVVTPRIGKPVEVQALWINALRIGAEDDAHWATLGARALESFRARFWSARDGYLYDVIDVDHHVGAVDARLRPNQLFAVGGLPWSILAGDRARRMVDVVESRLWTPLGPRTLARDDPAYIGRCEGTPAERDSAYHQGTVWPWLAGAFVEAWVRVRGGTPAVRAQARSRFLMPLVRRVDEAGLGHLTEIADGDAPHWPRGCPFQAWSVSEALRLDEVVLGARR